MKLNTLTFEDVPRGWQLLETSFSKLSLLVGASGVGKTQILRAIHTLKEIARGDSRNGIRWDLVFTSLAGNEFRWKGEFEHKITTKATHVEENGTDDPRILHETIWVNGHKRVSWDRGALEFEGKTKIKLARESSLLSHLEEDFVKEMKAALANIKFRDHSKPAFIPFGPRAFHPEKLAFEYDSLEKIRQSFLDVSTKLFLVSQNDPFTFSRIQARFSDIFPQVEKIKVQPSLFGEGEETLFIEGHLSIQIKEKGVAHWIPQQFISSGMLRSLFHISELYLAAEGTLFLIDEFENSLGVNCIDELVADILESPRNLQFILTSHHPYIINSIGSTNWKLVTRDGGAVKTHDAVDLQLGKSRHDAFMQLIQLEEYQTGSELA